HAFAPRHPYIMFLPFDRMQRRTTTDWRQRAHRIEKRAPAQHVGNMLTKRASLQALLQAPCALIPDARLNVGLGRRLRRLMQALGVPRLPFEALAEPQVTLAQRNLA